jgi:4-methyl-5(b-hydroxyethyl)-thiazole monophosphate biosynthesis
LPLGKSGVLVGRKATTYNGNPVRMETLKSFGASVISEPIVISENIITSWNPSTAADVAFWLLEKLTSPEQRAFVSKLMGFTR